MDTITCPFCQFACKPTARMCPSCGLTFERWLEANPGKTIEGWNPPATAPAPATPDSAVPVPPVAAAVPAEPAPPTPAVDPPSAAIAVPPAPVDPTSPAAQRKPPPGMKPELDPKAKALIELYKTEAAFRTNRGDAEKAPGRAGLLLIAMAITNIVFGLLLTLQRFHGDGLPFVSAFGGGVGFLIMAIGALLGHRRFVTAGVVLAVIDLAIGVSVFSQLGAGLRNTLGLKVIMLAYLAKLMKDLG